MWPRWIIADDQGLVSNYYLASRVRVKKHFARNAVLARSHFLCGIGACKYTFPTTVFARHKSSLNFSGNEVKQVYENCLAKVSMLSTNDGIYCTFFRNRYRLGDNKTH